MPDQLAQRSPILLFLFGWYLRWYFYRRFHAVRISRNGLPKPLHGRRLVIYSNHPSWWDPALFIVVGLKLLPERIGYGPMEAGQLSRYGLLRRMGVFGIDLTSPRGAAQFLQIGRRVLEDPSHALWVTAEGHFTDARRRPVTLRPGIAHFARHMPDVVFLPLAIEYPFWDESRPEALLRFGPPVELAPDGDISSWTAQLSAALATAMDQLSEDSITRDPSRFHSLIRGTTGVGGIYDAWRRSRAWALGRSFDVSHVQDQNIN